MYVQRRPDSRPPRRNSTLRVLGCGCAAVLGILVLLGVVGVVVLLPRLPQLAASLIGMTSRGQTNTLFQETPVPTPLLQNPAQPAEVTVNLGSYGGPQTIDSSNEFSGYYDIAVGSDTAGTQTAVVSVTEEGLLEVCRQRSPICSGQDSRFRNVRLDLRPGGAVVYADVSVPTPYGFTYDTTAGVVLQLDPSRRQFQFAGVDLDGELYDSPPAELQETVAEFERTGNDVLNQLSVNAGTGDLRLSEVQIDDATLTLILR